MSDLISRAEAIEAIKSRQTEQWIESDIDYNNGLESALCDIKALQSAEPEGVIPHRNYKYLSDYWCECGWHLGKKGEVKYCARCGRRVNWYG